jgi:PadR family transcriptional regulator, regulatory protein PadR
MKGDRLGEFEELTLLAVRAHGEPTYAVPIQQFVEKAAGRNVSMGAIYAALERLVTKGHLKSQVGEATRQRGGKRKRLFSITPLGMRTIRNLREVRERIWNLIEEGRRP